MSSLPFVGPRCFLKPISQHAYQKKWRISFWPRGPSSSAEVRGLVMHDMKEVEGVRQQEEQEDKRDEEIGDEVMERSKRSLNTRMKHGDDDGVNKAQT